MYIYICMVRCGVYIFCQQTHLGGPSPYLARAILRPQSVHPKASRCEAGNWEVHATWVFFHGHFMGFHGDFCWISHGGWGLMAIEWGFKWGRSDLWDIVGRSYQIYLLVMTITLRSHGPKLYSSMIYDINTVNFYRTVSPTWAGDESAG